MIKSTSRCCFFILLCISMWPTYAVTYISVDYPTLLQDAQRKGFVRVLIWLDVPPFISPSAEQKLALEKKENAVLAELGDTISSIGQQRNGLGGITVYASEDGLKRINNSINIRSVMKSSPEVWFQGADSGLIESIENEIIAHKSANVDVILNTENFAYDVSHEGTVLYKSTPELTAELLVKVPAFLDSLPTAHILNLSTLKTQLKPLANQSKLLLQIDMEGLFAIQERKDIRALQLTNTPARQKVTLDADVIEAARKFGFAYVNVSLQKPFGYSGDFSWIPDKAKQAQSASNEALIKDFFAAFAASDIKYLDISLFRSLSAYAQLSHAALKQLYLTPDPRIRRIQLGGVGIGVGDPVDVSGINPPAEIVLPTPAEVCINAVEWSGDLSKASIQYYLVTKPEDHYQEGDMFLAFRKRNKPTDLWFHTLTQAGSIWTKADSPPSPIPYNTDAHFKLKPIFRMHTGKYYDSINIANLNEPVEVLVGYGAGATPSDSFQDMLRRKQFEVIWQSDMLENTDYAYCLSVSKINKASTWAPKVQGLTDDGNSSP